MKGLELARKFYKECGEPMLKEKFPDIFPRLCPQQPTHLHPASS